MPFAAALSAHPVSSHATGEVLGQLFEAAGPHPDLLVILATPGHRGALEDIAATGVLGAPLEQLITHTS